MSFRSLLDPYTLVPCMIAKAFVDRTWNVMSLYILICIYNICMFLRCVTVLIKRCTMTLEKQKQKSAMEYT